MRNEQLEISNEQWFLVVSGVILSVTKDLGVCTTIDQTANCEILHFVQNDNCKLLVISGVILSVTKDLGVCTTVDQITHREILHFVQNDS